MNRSLGDESPVRCPRNLLGISWWHTDHRTWEHRTLDGGSDALLLEAANVLSRKFAGEDRILGEGLKVTAAQGVTVHANGWCEQDIGRSRFHLVGQMLTNLVEKVLVPCRSERDSAGEQCRLIWSVVEVSLGESLIYLGAAHEDASSSAVGAITGLDRRDVLGGNGPGPPEICRSKQRDLLCGLIVDDRDSVDSNADLFFEAQLAKLLPRRGPRILHQLLDSVLRAGGRRELRVRRGVGHLAFCWRGIGIDILILGGRFGAAHVDMRQ